MLIMPIYADQTFNCMTAVHIGIAKHLNKFHVTQLQLIQLIVDTINDKNIQRNIQKYASMFIDRPMSTAIDETAFAIAKLLRHNGSRIDFVRKGIHNTWITYCFIDLLAVILCFGCLPLMMK